MCPSCLNQDCYLSMKNDFSDFENHTSRLQLIVLYYRSNINKFNFVPVKNNYFHLTLFAYNINITTRTN